MYDFSRLKEFVKREFGVDPDSVNSVFQPIKERLTHQQLGERVQFSRDGIFYTDEQGRKHKGFLYIEKGYARVNTHRYNKETIVPKFHSCNCRTINEQKARMNFNGHYVFSNDAVFMLDLDNITKDLLLCKNCADIMTELDYPMNSTQYKQEIILENEVEQGFEDWDIPTNIEITKTGYTPGWDEKSKSYRHKKNFKCENPDCGIQLNSSYIDGYYLETHHISGVKTDNRDENLKCLCVLCHANVNEDHKLNYSRGANLQKVKSYLEIYASKLETIGNPYLSDWKRKTGTYILTD